MLAPEFGGDNRRKIDAGTYDAPVIAFPAHWAPLGMTLYQGTQFPERYRHGMFVTFHGSWNRAPRSQAGYKVVFVPFDANGYPTGTYETFADGFAGRTEFVSTRDARHRPGGVAVGPDGSLYITDTVRGRVWRIIHTGEEAAPSGASRAPAAAEPLVDLSTPGGRLYSQVCAACHMPSGTGVPGMLPSLVGSKVVGGDPRRLIDVLLHGSQAALPEDRERFGTVMPPFAMHNDGELASLATFLRRNFAPEASSDVSPAEVGAVRR